MCAGGAITVVVGWALGEDRLVRLGVMAIIVGAGVIFVKPGR